MGKSKHKNIKVCHLNVRSLSTGFLEFRDIILNNCMDVVTISETWITNDINSNIVGIAGYSLFRKDRTGRGGGIAVYVREELKCETIQFDFDIEEGGVESLWLNLKICNTNLVIGTIYRPPVVNISYLINLVDNVLPFLLSTYDNVVILGDFNVNFFNTGNKVSECFSTYGFSELISVPTRITQYSATLIDQIFINQNISNSSGTINADLITDHMLIYCELHLSVPKCTQTYVTYRNFNNLNYDDFWSDLQSIPFEDVFYLTDIESKVNFLTKCVTNLFHIHAPVCVKRVSKPHAPWLTDTIKIMIKDREKALSKYKNHNTPENWSDYKIKRNFVLNAIRKEKMAYISFLDKQKSSKQLWNALRTMNVYKTNSTNLPNSFADPNHINDHFLSVFDDNACPENVAYFNSNTFNESNTFKFNLVDESIVIKAINSLKSNASGTDGINLSMLLLCAPVISKHLLHIINCCLQIGYFPNAWKTALVSPLPKVLNPTSVNDLRPISLLPIFSKVLEKIVYTQINEYFSNHNIIPKHQSGFRKAHSTTTALLNLHDAVIRNLDNKLATVLIMLDFSKAFDTISHELMCAKLKYYGFDHISLLFFKNYLQSRSQLVRIGNAVSTVGNVSSGVPQGSILGPLLFIVYTADLYDKVQYMSMQTYADDTQLLCNFNGDNYHQATININQDLCRIGKYASENNLKLNASKSSAMIFTSATKYEELKSGMTLRMHNDVINWCDSAKNLGLLTDINLRFTKHISNLLQKTFLRLRLLYANKRNLNFNLKKKLCESLVLSIFYYCYIVYYPCLDMVNKKRIQKVQNTCCRYIFDLRKFDHVSNKISQIGWLNMENLFKYFILVFVHNICITSTPLYLKEKLIPRGTVHDVNIRGRNTLTMPLHSTSLFQRSFSYNAVNFYNKLDQSLKNYTINNFKKTLKKLILEHQLVGNSFLIN